MAASPAGTRKGRNPFDRADRIAFPAFSQSTWDCPDDDSFGTPRSEASLPTHAVGSGWTPGTAEGHSWLTRTEDGSGRGVDGYFAERERRGLLTPAGTPSDLMQRGPLFDLDGSSSGFSSRKTGSPTPAALSPEPVPDGSSSAGGFSRKTSPPTPAAPSADPALEKAPNERDKPASKELGGRLLDQPSADLQRIHAAETTATFGHADELCQQHVTKCIRPAPPCKVCGHGPSAEISTRETDSLSASSISFGPEDTRVRFGDVKDGAQANSSDMTHTNNDRHTSHGAAACLSQQPASVVRQLDFGDFGCPDAVAAIAAGTGSGQSRAFSSPCVRGESAAHNSRRNLARGSPKTGFSRNSASEPVDRNSSWSREIPAGLCPGCSPTLAEISPLRSPSTWSLSPSPCRAHAEASQRCNRPGPSVGSFLHEGAASSSLQEKTEAIAPDATQQLVAAMRQLGSRTPRGGLVLQLRLCGCGCGLRVGEAVRPATASAPASPSVASPVKDESPLRDEPPLKNVLHSTEKGVPSPPSWSHSRRVPSRSPLLRSQSLCSSLSMLSTPQHGDQDLAGQLSHARVRYRANPVWRRPRQVSRSFCESRSLEDLQRAVGKVWLRYEQRFLQPGGNLTASHAWRDSRWC
eukprot:TRINITY_DN29015_c0_g1_i1.p1 TRINITY_DN29015_c0_g1~~TRINITY_DN29015_c0_g1_i1.p1  ORF type:complete len:635 (+),score=78.06 TRINITY_DN29015_c0_g1_i1:20-1924(+)